ncbi:hypothetical protein NPIL_527861 [Nephila pilipes]|uniref:Uncharacterized protein n=1 Tax=Nephila pilipes TaxID=299642 RepID=A0A8X6P9G1_NEPPI|nr:hypothetical protein NPIL_527861 [Nephila pilipes]
MRTSYEDLLKMEAKTKLKSEEEEPERHTVSCVEKTLNKTGFRIGFVKVRLTRRLRRSEGSNLSYERGVRRKKRSEVKNSDLFNIVCLEFFLMRTIVEPQSAFGVDESAPRISSRGPLGPVPGLLANGLSSIPTMGPAVCLIMSHKWDFHVNSPFSLIFIAFGRIR